MHYSQALALLQHKMQFLVKEASSMYGNHLYPKFYKPLLELTDLTHYKRRRRIRPFVVVGSGMFSVVVRHPDVKGVLFKIHGDDGYDEYIKYCKSNYSPVHINVFDSVECGTLWTELTSEKIHIKVIEELEVLHETPENVNMLHNIKLFEEDQEYSIMNIPDLVLEHLHSMRNLSVSKSLRLDIWHNLMQRKNGDVVSIDPVVYSFL